MIRRASNDDLAALLALCESIGLFPADELAELGAMMAEHLEPDAISDHHWLVDDEDGDLVAVAYVAPERLTNGTWNLFLIAVRDDLRGRGRGSSLVRHVERLVAGRGAHLLLVETAGVPEFEKTRGFYARLGFDREAIIRDFYADGVDKVVFRKRLAEAG
jgi:ribosomal protein S18 acetylase RimI-like enzyme